MWKIFLSSLCDKDIKKFKFTRWSGKPRDQLKKEKERRETHVVFGSWESSGKDYGTIAAISI